MSGNGARRFYDKAERVRQHALRVSNGGEEDRGNVEPAAQLPGHLDPGTPTEVLPVLSGSGLSIGLLVGTLGGGTATDVERLALGHGRPGQPQTNDKAKASERKPTFHKVTTLKKFRRS